MSGEPSAAFCNFASTGRHEEVDANPFSLKAFVVFLSASCFSRLYYEGPGLQSVPIRSLAVQGVEVKTSRHVSTDIGGLQFEEGDDATAKARSVLPPDGRSWTEVQAELIARKRNDYDWRSGRIPIYVYHDNDELLAVSRNAYGLYFSENALGRTAFPSLVEMESEIVAMSLSLFHAPDTAGGSFTSGGTESIFLAMKTARDQFKANRRRDMRPSIVVPRTAHPVFDKAAQYLGVDVVRVREGRDLRADVVEMQAAIDARTMMIVGSAPCYPYGVYDPIRQLGEIAI